jgi:hypothetical protein
MFHYTILAFVPPFWLWWWSSLISLFLLDDWETVLVDWVFVMGTLGKQIGIGLFRGKDYVKGNYRFHRCSTRSRSPIIRFVEWVLYWFLLPFLLCVISWFRPFRLFLLWPVGSRLTRFHWKMVSRIFSSSDSTREHRISAVPVHPSPPSRCSQCETVRTCVRKSVSPPVLIALSVLLLLFFNMIISVSFMWSFRFCLPFLVQFSCSFISFVFYPFLFGLFA